VRETYVRPPLVARELRSRWLTVWPLRVLAVVLVALLAWGFILLLRVVLKPADEGGGIGALARPTSSAQGHR
jgi:hypothetical protein